MSAIGSTIRSSLAAVFKPELKSRRILHKGVTPASFLLLGVVTAIVVALAKYLPGETFTLYLPNYFDWQWIEVKILDFPVWMWAVFWALAAGLCLFPSLTGPAIGIAFSLYFLYAAVNGATVNVPFSDTDLFSLPYLGIFAYHHYLPMFVAFSAVLVFVYFPASSRSPMARPSVFDIILCLLTLAATFDFIWNFEERGEREGLIHWNDVVFGAIMIAVSLEMCRRVLGLILPLLGAVFFFYCWFGEYVPGALGHSGFGSNELIAYMNSQSAIYGAIAGVFAQYVFPFIVFGTILQMTKIGDVFVDIAFSLVGRTAGGAAKSAVVSSGMVGSIIGSGAANIAVTGTFTIPLMKRSGYQAHYAAGVEAVASIGGQLMPPIMGSAAFLVASFTNTDYVHVALISTVPALMYFYSLYMQVHFRALKVGIKGLPREELPQFWQVLKKDGYRLLPIVLLITLLIMRFSPFYAAFWSICFALLISCLREDTRQLQVPGGLVWLARLVPVPTRLAPAKQAICATGAPTPEDGETVHRGLVADWGGIAAGLFILVVLRFVFGMGWTETAFFAVAGTVVLSSQRLMYTLSQGALASLVLNATAGIMGIVLAGVTLPGLALRFPAIMLEFADGSLPILILLCAVASYIMGMGMTITAAYVILAILAVPALMSLGVPELNAHLMILWLSQDSSLTPPFALGAFIAAGIARADPTRTGFTSVLLAKPLYIVPFLMAYSPILMDPGSAWWDIAIVWATGFIGFYSLAAGMEGYFRRELSWPERLLLMGISGCLFFQIWWLNAAAILTLVVLYMLQSAVRGGLPEKSASVVKAGE